MSEPVDVVDARIAGHTVLSMVAVIALGLTRLVFGLLVTQQFGAAVLGRVNTQLAIATFASLLFASSTSIAAQKWVSAALGGGNQVGARHALLIALRWCAPGTAAVTVAMAFALVWFLPRLSLVEVGATCLLFVTYSAYLFVRGAQYGYGVVRRNAVLETACDVVAIAAAVVVVLLGAELILLLPFIVGYTLFAVFGWVGLPRPARTEGRPPAPPAGLRREMGGYAAWAALALLASTGFLQLSMIVAYKFNSELDAGLYAAAFILTVPAFFLPRALSMALFPAMAGAFGRGDAVEVRRQLDAGTKFLLVGSLPFFAAGVYFAEPILVRTLGSEVADAHVILELLLVATYVMIVAIPAVNALSATHTKLVRVNAAASSSGLLVGLIGWLILEPAHGITGIALGYLIGVFVASSIGLAAAWRRWHVPWAMLFVRAGVIVAFAVALRVLANETRNGYAIRLGCTLAVAALTAVVCLPETRQILGRLRPLTAQARAMLSR